MNDRCTILLSNAIYEKKNSCPGKLPHNSVFGALDRFFIAINNFMLCLFFAVIVLRKVRPMGRE